MRKLVLALVLALPAAACGAAGTSSQARVPMPATPAAATPAAQLLADGFTEAVSSYGPGTLPPLIGGTGQASPGDWESRYVIASAAGYRGNDGQAVLQLTPAAARIIRAAGRPPLPPGVSEVTDGDMLVITGPNAALGRYAASFP